MEGVAELLENLKNVDINSPEEYIKKGKSFGTWLSNAITEDGLMKKISDANNKLVQELLLYNIEKKDVEKLKEKYNFNPMSQNLGTIISQIGNTVFYETGFTLYYKTKEGKFEEGKEEVLKKTEEYLKTVKDLKDNYENREMSAFADESDTFF